MLQQASLWPWVAGIVDILADWLAFDALRKLFANTGRLVPPAGEQWKFLLGMEDGEAEVGRR